MKRVLTAVVASMVLTSATAWAKTETIKGQVVDQACYTKDKVNNKGIDHKMPADTKDCALACAKQGNRMALLTADGKVFAIYGDLAANKNAKLVAHIGHTVEMTGDTMDMSGSLMITAADLKLVAK